jgi:predicted DNA-binding transcriptional regulator YafY
MAKLNYFNRYFLIIKKLRLGPATFEEICDYLSLKDDELITSKRTFQRDIKEIASLFDIEIEYDFVNRAYMIDEGVPTDLSSRMLEAFDMFHALNMSENLSPYIHFESRKPQGTEHFHELLQAIKKGHLVKIVYRKFWEGEATERILEPYALKEAQGRWYVIAKEPKGEIIKTFGLDRIEALEVTKHKFIRPKGLDTNEMFKYSFGVINELTKPPQKVVLSFAPNEGEYIKTYPLHNSQEILDDNDDELRIQLSIQPTYDFMMELLSRGHQVKVNSPKSLQKEIIANYKKALGQYEKSV